MNETSRKLFERARKCIPGGVNSPVRAFNSVGGDPLYISHGAGSKLYDVDGNEYVDYVCSWGPLILGHAEPRVQEAIVRAASNGATFGANAEIEVRFAELITSLVPSIDMIRMVSSGTEATMSAVRLARGYTGREKIVKFEGCYHGHADGFLIDAGSGVLTLGIPGSPGVTEGAARDTLVAKFNDIGSVKNLFEKYPDQIAALIVEPVMGNAGVIPPEVSPGGSFLHQLREVTQAHGSLLVFDEVITGFRVGLGGAQELFGVKPDLTCLGKIIGGGLPVGAFGGLRRIMEYLAPIGPVYQAGTLSGNPIAMSAGHETIRILRDEPVHRDLERKAARLARGIEDAVDALGLPYRLNRVGSMMSLFFAAGKVKDSSAAQRADTEVFKRYFEQMIRQGIYIAPSAFEASFVSAAHGDEDIERTIAAVKHSLEVSCR